MLKTLILNMIFIACLLTGCTPKPQQVVAIHERINMYPDYEDITIPVNIAPLNFLLRGDSVEAVTVILHGKTDSLVVHSSDNKVCFPIKKWKKLMQNNVKDTISVTVIAKINNQWLSYPSFYWNISPDSIDSYLSYRLIEPGYEVWNRLHIKERNLENFDEQTLADNKLMGGKCMNCHVYGNNEGNLSMFHLRGKNGGTILNQDGRIRKLSLKNDEMISAAVYGGFHPSGAYGVFSTNIIIPEFHSTNNHRLEVYDSKSDLVIADFVNNRMITSPLVSDTLSFETFPTFSADGKTVYFCSAPVVALPDSIRQLCYSLCSIAFDAEHKIWGNRVDTLWNANEMNGSVCHPKTSPDGKYILYTVADYGTFPIWHKETDLQLMELSTGNIDTLQTVNSNRSDTYHSWSSSSKWFAFASKRGDGQYGRVYFAYIAPNGNVGKPFVLPQANPENDDLNLKSYNIPELSKNSVPFNANSLESMVEQIPVEPFN